MMRSCLPTPIGYLHLSAADGIVTEICFADAPLAEASLTSGVLKVATGQLLEYFEGARTSFDFPMRQPGTGFQQRVWQELLRIPFGKTLSYGELSKELGDLKATRAVGAANGRNRLAIVVPCHRVIGSSQALTGYAGGLHRKRWLLAHEAKWASGVQTLF